MKNTRGKALFLILLIGFILSENVYAQPMRELFEKYRGKNLILLANNKAEGTTSESKIDLYFTDSKNIMLFKILEIYCLEVNLTEGYIEVCVFDFDEFKLVEHGAKIYAYIVIDKSEIVIKPVKDKNIEMKVKIVE